MPVELWRFLLYFLKLGATGFGGPIALAGFMQRDLVEDRKWITASDYADGLALAQLAPGPLAAQLAIYLGYVRAGVLGASLVAVVFVLPSFLMVWGISAAYVHFGGLPWIQALFYGIGATVIGVIARSSVKLTRLTLKKDIWLWAIFGVTAVSTALTQAENIWLILGGGFLMIIRGGWRPSLRMLAIAPSLATAAIATSPPTLTTLFWFFAKSGAVVFGSGLAIVPFLYGEVVQAHGWLTQQQFIDAVAVAMITPGPVVITVAFIGYLISGTSGMTVAAIGVFLPVYLFVIIPAPYFRKYRSQPQVTSFIAGVTAAATGAIAGAVWVLGSRAIVDVWTAVLAIAAFAVLTRWKISELWVIGLGALAGLCLAGR